MATKWISLDKLRYTVSKIYTLLQGKVDKTDGKGLSTNDLTNELKNQYDAAYQHSQASHAPSNAERNVIAGIQVNAKDLTPDGSRKVNITVPTGKLASKDTVAESDLTPELQEKVNAASEGTHGHINKEVLDQLEQADLDKLDGIEEGANKTVVDSALNESSTNPVQNKVVNAALAGKAASSHTHAAATSEAAGMMSAADKAKLDGFGTAATYALKSDITQMYRYKGSVADASKLPASDQVAGDVYDIQAESQYGSAGTNVAWNGSAWDALGGAFTIEECTNAEIDQIFTDLAG